MSFEQDGAQQASRAKRADGVATRARILDVALLAFAQHGYGHVNSKAICQEAGVNSAAINYYFGGYDQLYIAVMHEAHQHFLRKERLDEVLAASGDPTQRLDLLIEVLVAEIAEQPWFYGHLWLRESMSPTQNLAESYRELSNDKRRIIMQVLADYLGVPRNDSLVDYSFLTFFSPFMLILLKHASLETHYGVASGLAKDELISYLRCYARAGLDAVLARRRQLAQDNGSSAG